VVLALDLTCAPFNHLLLTWCFEL